MFLLRLFAVALLLSGALLASAAAPAVSSPDSPKPPEPPPVAEVQPNYGTMARYFGNREGLPLSSVLSIVQTADGYLWLGTYGGLVRFDGRNFTRFGLHTHPHSADSSPSTLPSDRILALHEDAQQRLWIGTEDAGLALRQNGRFQSVDVCNQSCQINSILPGNDILWLGTDNGLLRLDPGSLRSQVIPGPGQPPHNVGNLTYDSRERLFMIADRRLAQFDAGRIRLLATPPQIHDINALMRWDRGLLVGSSDLLHYLPEENHWRAWGVGAVSALQQTSDGRRFASMRDGRLLQLHADGSHTQIQPAESTPILYLESDDENNLWLGTTSDGLIQLRQPWIGTAAQDELGTPSAGRAIISDRAGGLWLALNCAGLRHWHADGRIENWPGLSQHDSECLNSLHLARNGTLWAGGNSGNLMRMRPGQAHPEKALQLAKRRPILALYALSDTRLLAATHREVWRIELDAQDEVIEQHPIPELYGLTIKQIVPARAGGLWFVGDHGVLRLDERDRVLERWGPEQGLPGRFARSLHESADGTLWIGTYGGGLNRIAQGQLTVFNRHNGLSEDSVSCILEDRQGRLWLGGNHGATLLLNDGRDGYLKSVLFNGSSGLYPAEINGGAQNACAQDDNGRLWFALMRGFAVLDPMHDAIPLRRAPRTYIERILVDGQPQPVDAPLNLGVNARSVEIDFTAIDLTAPENLRFRFRLSGINSDWIEAGNNRRVFYPGIPWGKHVFEVQARAEGLPWPSSTVQLSILRPAPWYQSPWIWLLCTVAALLLLLDVTWQRRPPAASSSKT